MPRSATLIDLLPPGFLASIALLALGLFLMAALPPLAFLAWQARVAASRWQGALAQLAPRAALEALTAKVELVTGEVAALAAVSSNARHAERDGDPSRDAAPPALQALAARLDSLAADLQKIEVERLAANSREQDVHNDLTARAAGQQALQARIASLETWTQTVQGAAVAPGAAPRLERGILEEAWKQAKETLLPELDSGGRDGDWQQVQTSLLVDLPRLVPDELRAPLQAVLSPARDHYNLTARLALIPKLLSGEVQALTDTVQNTRRLREMAQLLAILQVSSLVMEPLRFRPRGWIADHFLGIADLLLQSYQQACMDGDAGALEPAMEITRRVLAVADLAAIDVDLGSTAFDGQRHIGRSTTRNPDFPDGVILGVVRNGFLRDGREVIRQPEVVVNRVR